MVTPVQKDLGMKQRIRCAIVIRRLLLFYVQKTSSVLSQPIADQIPRNKERGWQRKEREKEQRQRNVTDAGRKRKAGSNKPMGVFLGRTWRGLPDFLLRLTSEERR